MLPLSYNPIEANKLNEVLQRYEGKFHPQLITDFEKELALKTGAKQVVALNSGTAAIHMALRVLGIGEGDVVIAPTFTYVATVNPILYQGATPVFVDSEKESWNMDPELLELALQEETKKGKRIKAILAMHTYGMPTQMDRILKVAAAYHIPVIEDAAEAVGSFYQGKAAGTLGRVGIYSFNTNKVFTTFGGGALLTDDAVLAEKVRFMAAQSREHLPYYEHREIGFNYLMGALPAAYGLAQLPELNKNIILRRSIFETYASQLKQAEFQPEMKGSYSNRWLPAALFKDERTKHAVAKQLDANGLETRPLWRPMHLQPLFKRYPFYENGLSESFFERGLCLPTGVTLTASQQEELIELMIKSFGF